MVLEQHWCRTQDWWLDGKIVFSQNVNTGVGLTGLVARWKDCVFTKCEHWYRTHRTDDQMDRSCTFTTTLV